MDKPADMDDQDLSMLIDGVSAVSIGLLAAFSLWLWLGTGESLAVLAKLTGLPLCL
ncbi:MAG: hypothetical protein AAF412_02925 [Pseudomonadota bacterium]